MRIGFEAFPIQERPSGVGKYVLSLIEKIAKEFPDAEFFAYSNRRIGLPDYLEKRVDKREFYSGLEGKLPGMLWLKFFLKNYANEDKLDFYISATGFFPQLSSNIKRIAVVHDLNYKIVPETMSKMYYLSHLIYFKKDVRSSDFLITNTHGTAEKVYHFFKKSVDEIINPPISSQYFKKSNEEVSYVLEKYGLFLNKPYLLFVGNLEPRKNLVFTLNNFVELIKSGNISNTKLVIVGLRGWRDKKIQTLLKNYSEYVDILGYVDEIDLPCLYSGAKLFVFPSLYEGFGMPVREALLCGTRVLTSNLPELREAGSIADNMDMVVYINPKNKADFKEKIISLINKDNNLPLIENKRFDFPKLLAFLNQ